MTSPYTGLADRRAADRRTLPAADASGAHFQRKAAEERAALAEQQRDEAIRQRQVTAGRMNAQIEQLRAQVEQLRGRAAVLQDFHDRIAATVDTRRADR